MAEVRVGTGVRIRVTLRLRVSLSGKTRVSGQYPRSVVTQHYLLVALINSSLFCSTTFSFITDDSVPALSPFSIIRYAWIPV